MTDYVFREVKRAYTKYQTRDPFELLDAMGAKVVFTHAFERNGLKGYSTMMNRIKYAVINARLTEPEQIIVAGHEAAHLILHMNEIMSSPVKALQDFNMFDNTGKIEYQANLFLSDFILADETVMECVQDADLDFFSTASALAIPPPLLAFKLYSMMRRGFEVRSPIDLESQFLR